MRRAWWIALGSWVSALSIAAGCGGIGDSDSLFNKDDGTSTFGAGGASTGSTATSGPTTTTTSGGQTTSVSVSSSSSTTSSTTSSSSSSTTASSSSTTTTTTTSSTTTTTTGGGGETIPCGNSSCPLGGDNACCWDLAKLNGDPQAECVNGPPDNDGCITQQGQNQGYETRIECQTSDQCDNGQVCCGHRIQVGQNFAYYNQVVCQDSCDWPDITMCEAGNPNAPCPTIQTQNGPLQLVCKASTLLPDGYWVCGTP